MKWILLGLVFSSALWAETSRIIPSVFEAAEIYVESDQDEHDESYLRPDIRAALRILREKKVSKEYFKEILVNKTLNFDLPEDDDFDQWTIEESFSDEEVPEVALHAYKLDVHAQAGTFFKDDIYTYFFVTDGVIPTGKVTSVYKGVGSGKGFFFSETDRSIFPVPGMVAKKPHGHLIVDYGVIKFNGDNVKEMQKISSVIIDIAIAVYQAYDPENSEIIVNLRKEIKALTEILIGLKKDDRLATGSFGYKNSEISELLKEDSYLEFSKIHSGTNANKKWEYEVFFRLLRN